MSWFRAASKASAGAADTAEGAEAAARAKIGTLPVRSDQIPRAHGDMQAHIERCLNGELGQYDKQKGTPAPLQKLYGKMEWTIKNVIGREKNKDHDEIKPTLALTFALNKKEVDKYRKMSDGFHESQRACLKLREISTVETSVTDFSQGSYNSGMHPPPGTAPLCVPRPGTCTPLQVTPLSSAACPPLPAPPYTSQLSRFCQIQVLGGGCFKMTST